MIVNIESSQIQVMEPVDSEKENTVSMTHINNSTDFNNWSDDELLSYINNLHSDVNITHEDLPEIGR